MEPNITPSPYLPDGRQWAWSSTVLGLGKECLYKYYLAVRCGWAPKSLNDDIIFGMWYASALEVFHKLRADDMAYDDALNEVVRQTLQNTVYKKCPTCNGHGTSANEPQGCVDCLGTGRIHDIWVSEHRAKDRQTLIRSIVWYLEEYKDDPCKTVILKDGRAAVELTFQFKYADEITLCGHLDRLVEYAGDYYIQDQKTTGATMGSYYFKRYTPDNQMSLYTAAGQVIWQLPVKGVMIDAAQIAVGFTRFERGFAFRTPEQIEEWLVDAEWHIHHIWEATLKNRWPQNDQVCQKYGGCQFLSICAKSPQVREEFLKTDFETRTINPLEVR